MSDTANKALPAPPTPITDPDRLAVAEERWQHCPLRDCKRNHDLLYEDFYLRGIRSNRVLCSACATRVEVGYMAREEVRKVDDRYFKGTQLDNLIVFASLFLTMVIACVLSSFIGWFYVAFLIGGAFGGVGASMARRLTKGRVTRQTPIVGAAGVIVAALGMLLIPIPMIYVSVLTVIACAVGIGLSAWSILHRRI